MAEVSLPRQRANLSYIPREFVQSVLDVKGYGAIVQATVDKQLPDIVYLSIQTNFVVQEEAAK